MSNPIAPTKPNESDRRRSTRVMLVIPVEVKYMTKEGPWVQEHAETEVVSLHGAMLRMKARLTPGTQMEVRRPEISKSAKAKVVGAGSPSNDGLARIAIEILPPNDSTFWGVCFPAAAALPAPKAAEGPRAAVPSPAKPAKPSLVGTR